ncbi:hypothetical protein ES708_19659 [subsurface metagenome]
MIGKVRAINQQKGFIAVETDGNEFSVIELLGEYGVEIGDVISGDIESLGGETVINKTQSEEMDVFIQDCHCDAQRVRQLT